MKRFHVHISVPELDAAIPFYSHMFGAQPSVQHADYAKWMLDEPRINFAISQRGAAPGLDHLGFQVDSGAELSALQAQLAATEAPIKAEPGTACCYARSDKHWITDPAGIAWEHFHTLENIPTFNEAPPAQAPSASGCCAPRAGTIGSCC